MRATNDKLGERYIIVVARELSKALKGLHDAGIMHRDIKGTLCPRIVVACACQLCLVFVFAKIRCDFVSRYQKLTCDSLSSCKCAHPRRRKIAAL